MPIAFVFINTAVGSENNVLNELKIPCIKEIYPVFGVYDIIVKIDTDSLEQLKKIVSNNIRHLNQVQSTLTLLVKES